MRARSNSLNTPFMLHRWPSGASVGYVNQGDHRQVGGTRPLPLASPVLMQPM